VADLLGHPSTAITGDVYGHTSDDTARAATDGLAGRLGLCPLAYQIWLAYRLAHGMEKALSGSPESASDLVGLTGFEPATT
jgi:hypothetical protein